MRAKRVFEFEKGGDPKKSLNLGHGKHVKTKGFKILDFIAQAGKEGRSFTEIQKFIWTEIRGYKEEDFWKKDTPATRLSRGTYTTGLYGTQFQKGLLTTYCHKNEKGKWVLDRFPRPDENMYAM